MGEEPTFYPANAGGANALAGALREFQRVPQAKMVAYRDSMKSMASTAKNAVPLLAAFQALEKFATSDLLSPLADAMNLLGGIVGSELQPLFDELFKTLKEAGVIDALRDTIREVGALTSAFLGPDGLKNAVFGLKVGVGELADVVRGITGLFTGDFSAVVEGIKSMVLDFPAAVQMATQQVFANLTDGILGWLASVGAAIGTWFENFITNDLPKLLWEVTKMLANPKNWF